MRSFSIALFALLIAFPAEAATTDWTEIAPGTTIRLISSDIRADDGTTRLGLEIRLPPGTKTYWRVPGETGIPAQFDFSASTGVGAATLLWPFPARETEAGYVDHVYYGDVTFPVELATTSGAPEIDLDLMMGVCSDICVPATAHLALPLDFTRPDSASRLRIMQAEADVPVVWDRARPAIAAIGFDPEANELQLSGIDPLVDLQSLIASTDDPAELFGPPQKSPITGLITLKRLGRGGKLSLAGEPVTLIFNTPNGPYKLTMDATGIEH